MVHHITCMLYFELLSALSATLVMHKQYVVSLVDCCIFYTFLFHCPSLNTPALATRDSMSIAIARLLLQAACPI